MSNWSDGQRPWQPVPPAPQPPPPAHPAPTPPAGPARPPQPPQQALPQQVIAGWNGGPTGKQILTSSWRLLKQDRELIALPILGSVFGLVAFAIFFVPGLILGLGAGDNARVPIYVGAVLGGFLSSVIAIFFQAALVVGAYQRADGYDPTLGGVLAVAWRMRGKILGWAVFTTVVGTIIRAVEQRLGVVGRILGFLGGIAWAIATFFVVPIVVAEGLGPIDALKRSATTIRQMWGTSVRTTLRFGFIQFVLTLIPVALIVVGIALLVTSANADRTGGVAGGVLIAGIGFIALFLLGTVFGAISTYARALIYRWATGRPVPGIDPEVFAGAFAARRRNRGWA